jgi:hypothetical protein
MGPQRLHAKQGFGYASAGSRRRPVSPLTSPLAPRPISCHLLPAAAPPALRGPQRGALPPSLFSAAGRAAPVPGRHAPRWPLSTPSRPGHPASGAAAGARPLAGARPQGLLRRARRAVQTRVSRVATCCPAAAGRPSPPPAPGLASPAAPALCAPTDQQLPVPFRQHCPPPHPQPTPLTPPPPNPQPARAHGCRPACAAGGALPGGRASCAAPNTPQCGGSFLAPRPRHKKSAQTGRGHRCLRLHAHAGMHPHAPT